MAYFSCPHCGEKTSVFSSGGVDRESKKLGIEILGSIPLNADICSDADKGLPSVLAVGIDNEIRREPFKNIADKILKKLGL
jgi:ATP-binding protein involved in chromosome partitioning